MQDPLDAVRRATTCSFCKRQLSTAVKLIPDCGKFICGICYDHLKESVDESRKYECTTCGNQHTLPENGMADVTQLLDLLRNPVEKPLSDQAKKLQLLIGNVQELLARLEAFDPKQSVDEYCEQLELQVAEAAESALKHIKEIESGLLKRIKEYRQKNTDALTAKSSNGQGGKRKQPQTDSTRRELERLSHEINEFNAKWNDYFSRLKALASEAEIETALLQTVVFQARMRELDQEQRNSALNGSLLQFNANEAFLSQRDHLGQLKEISASAEQTTRKEITIQETASRTLTGHSDWIMQVLFLPDGRLASCSDDTTIKVWDPAGGKELFTLRGHKEQVYSIAVLSNGWLASGSRDMTIKLWNLEARREVKTLQGHTREILSLKVLKNGHLVSYSCDDTMKIWNPLLNENTLLSTIEGHGNVTWLAPLFRVLSNDLLVTCSRDRDGQEESTLRVWDPKDGRLVKSLSIGVRAVLSLFVLSNDQVAVGTEDATIKIIDLEDDQKTRIKEKAHYIGVSCLLQLSNGNLVSSGKDQESSTFYSNGNLVSSGKDQESSTFYSIKVWNLSDWSLLQRVKTDHSDHIRSLSISHNEQILASSSHDNTIKLWPLSSEDVEYD